MITIPEYVTVPTWAILVGVIYLAYLHFFSKAWDKLWRVFRVRPDGYIYLMRRADGIYKVGKTVNLTNRQQQLSQQYRQPVYLISSWPAPNLDTYEARALELTSRYAIDRSELRAMSQTEAITFVFTFTQIVNQGIE